MPSRLAATRVKPANGKLKPSLADSSISAMTVPKLPASSPGNACTACSWCSLNFHCLSCLYNIVLSRFSYPLACCTLSGSELVLSRGYPLERHTVVTPDGYELVLFRIPHGAQRQGSLFKNRVPAGLFCIASSLSLPVSGNDAALQGQCCLLYTAMPCLAARPQRL